MAKLVLYVRVHVFLCASVCAIEVSHSDALAKGMYQNCVTFSPVSNNRSKSTAGHRTFSGGLHHDIKTNLIKKRRRFIGQLILISRTYLYM